MKRIVVLLSLLALLLGAKAERTFVHPGCSYTQGQLDRMKAMVEAKVEPYYTTYLNLKNSEHAALDRKVSDRGTQIREGQFNGTVGIDGRCAHDLALLWHITGDKRYADKAVEYLNANNHYTSTSARGTGPLDNGKINLLIEAAELMRDYEGWAPEEQQRFKDMLTYPYYSNTEDVFAKYGHWTNDDLNGVTFYWNIYNGDCSRYGNQGMFAMLGMLAMGVYLDNELIYERALRYVSGLPHREDDLAYPSGPPITSSRPSSQDEFQKTYTLEGRSSSVEDYGYDELLEYYFYPNGQCQESSRDQGHVLAGVHKYIEFAEIAWNQGDRFYSLHDNRLLKGIEFNYRYNLSFFQSYPDQTEPWEPAGYTDNWDEVTLDNNLYLQTRSRSGRWESIKPSPNQRGAISNVGSRTSAFSHYLVRAGESDKDTKWLRRTQEYVLDKYGYETSGTAPNWFYEWNGWGTLTKALEPWMAGDPGSFENGERCSGIHVLPGSFKAADYDYYNLSENGEGHTYHKLSAAQPSAYRPDGGVALRETDGNWVVTDLHDGEWLSYTVASPVADTFSVYVTCRGNGESQLALAVSGGEKEVGTLSPSSDWEEVYVGTVYIPAGASVLRLYVEQAAPDLEIEALSLKYDSSFEPSAEIEGVFDAKSKTYTLDWAFTGMLPSDIKVWRCVNAEPDTAEVVSSANTLGHFVDNTIEGNVSGYTYWVTYFDGIAEATTAKVSFEWGHLDDSFENEEVTQWTITGANGTGVFTDGEFVITPNSSGAIRLGRSWSFPFHGGNYPILAFRMDRPEGMTTALYSGANSWANGYDTFDGCVAGNVYYYNLLNNSFQNSKGVTKDEVSADEITVLPLQLRFTGTVGSEPLRIYWARTYKSLDDLQQSVEAEDSGVYEIASDAEKASDRMIYNLFGVACGSDPAALPFGIYVINGKKILIK